MNWRHAFWRGNQAPASWPARSAAAFLGLCLIGVVTYWVLILNAPKVAVAPSSASNASGRDVSAGQATQLFGVLSNSAPQPTSSSLASVQVQGIISAGPRGAAVISLDSKPGRFVGVGSTLAPERPEARVVEVRAESVVIDINGRKEQYEAPQRTSTAILTSGVGKTKQSAPGNAPPAMDPRSPPPPPAMQAPPTQQLPQAPAPGAGSGIPASQPAPPPPLPAGAAAAGPAEAAAQGVNAISPRAGSAPASVAKPGPSNP